MIENRALAEKILDKIAEDPEFRNRLLDDPESALAEAGLLPEAVAPSRAQSGKCSQTCGLSQTCSPDTCKKTCDKSCQAFVTL
jgi:hypothetical protein